MKPIGLHDEAEKLADCAARQGVWGLGFRVLTQFLHAGNAMNLSGWRNKHAPKRVVVAGMLGWRGRMCFEMSGGESPGVEGELFVPSAHSLL